MSEIDNYILGIPSKDEIVRRIKKVCDSLSTRQRDEFYDALNKEFDITIDRAAYKYKDARTDHARVECTNDAEFMGVIYERVLRELKKER
ncbi:hypothetical protein PGH07_07965 [Sulfurovum sp. zt1-1]|uniref:Uncharacterized protein n=1 Tax=Sulfurovum zhangzhouensis TaxID=3019067 RepID=A0ABT7QZ97_9BACT|nr:hypothetical protein [Sulfurovum zhangzhouensis]MDM5272113.1 hypothetical protein [Sulfurovum zhangzhouensis]